MQDRFRESLDYLYGLQFFGIKLGLDNIRSLLEKVGNPQQDLRIIHIAGTNGKGSTAAALASIFHRAGISAGLYTSPHLHCFTERIRIDTRPIDQAEVTRLLAEVRPHAEQLEATFFEVATAMALLSFQRHGVAWAILETGMGGRLDATNAVVPELCLLTRIGVDHSAYLGARLEQIAEEKAGILKSEIPVVSVRQQPEVETVLRQRAQALQAPFFVEGRDYRWRAGDGEFDFYAAGMRVRNIKPFLPGQFQYQNLSLAAAAVRTLNAGALNIGPQQIKEGLERVRWPGRLEWLTPSVLVDGAHNADGAAALAGYLRREQLHNVHLVIGCKADKNYAAILAALLPFVRSLQATEPPVEAAVEMEKLVQQARRSGLPAAAHKDPGAAFGAACAACREQEIVLVAGSLFLVAAIREALLAEPDRFSIVID